MSLMMVPTFYSGCSIINDGGPACRHQRPDKRQKVSHCMGPVIWIPGIGIRVAIYGRAQFLPKARKSPLTPLMSLSDLHVNETPCGQVLFSAWNLWRFFSPTPNPPIKADATSVGTQLENNSQCWAAGERPVRVGAGGWHMQLWDLIPCSSPSPY